MWKSEAVNEMPFGGVIVYGCAVKPDPLMLHAVVVVVLYLWIYVFAMPSAAILSLKGGKWYEKCSFFIQ